MKIALFGSGKIFHKKQMGEACVQEGRAYQKVKRPRKRDCFLQKTLNLLYNDHEGVPKRNEGEKATP